MSNLKQQTVSGAAYCLAAFLLAVGSSFADLELPSMISDGMVLQRDAQNPVWGRTDPGANVEVRLADKVYTTTADQHGAWRVAVGPFPAGGPHVLTVNAGATAEIKDVLIGEVWLCSGQSNMQWGLRSTPNGRKDAGESDDPNLRLFWIPPLKASQPQTDLPDKLRWLPATERRNVELFSAVGYYFGRELRERLSVPVGLVQAAVGGSHAEPWMPADLFKNEFMLKQREIEGPINPEKDGLGIFYNAMIAPLAPYGIRGVVWWQGESNRRGTSYRRLFAALIGEWRRVWGRGDFPFFYVQLQSLGTTCKPLNFDGNYSPQAKRDGQRRVLELPNTGMAVTFDITDGDLHPKDKKGVGERLALIARAKVYGEKIEYSGPMVRSVERKGNDVLAVAFDHAAGMTAKDGDLTGFDVLTGGDKPAWQPVKARINGETVQLDVAGLNKPAAVRYAWACHPTANLYNGAGLPASPFWIRVAPGTDPLPKQPGKDPYEP